MLAAFKTVYPLLHTPQAVERMAYEAAMSEARHNVRYLEVRFAPALNAGEGFSSDSALKAALKGLARAEKRSGVKTGDILCLLRPFAHVSREQNEETVALAIRYKDRGVVAVDLAGDEAAQPLSDFRGLFAKAKAAGLRLTVHAGETPRSRDLETALDIGVDRIGHATLLASQPRLLRKFQERRPPIEVNLTSNLRTSAVKDLSGHPVRQWYAAGVPVALSTDDPGVFGIDLDHEYGLLAHALDFRPEAVLAVSFEGIEALFLPAARKKALRERFEAELLAILRDLSRKR
ncbi:MAG: adenosine deaminase [Elusimicrobia bacterium]|nr:adenosine deaminase [Elusimicrobiota bacterium]